MRLWGALWLCWTTAAIATCELPPATERKPLGEICPALVEQINELDLAQVLPQFSADTPVDAAQLAALEAWLDDYRQPPPVASGIDHAQLREVIKANSSLTPLVTLSLRERALRWMRERLASYFGRSELPKWLDDLAPVARFATWLLPFLAVFIVIAAIWIVYREALASGWLGPRARQRKASSSSRLLAATVPTLGAANSAAALNHQVGAALMARLALGDDRALTSPERARLIRAHASSPVAFLDALAHAADEEEFGALKTPAQQLADWRDAAMRALG
jgi:hypothetical protein